jgi:hypothetical protein
LVDRDESDKEKIRELIDRMFTSISWTDDKAPDWDAFSSTFCAGGKMVPSARPVVVKGVDAFTAEMEQQRKSGQLTRLSEKALGYDIRVFANIAVAMYSFHADINADSQSRGVNAFLLVKEAGEWSVVATAWDNEDSENPLPQLQGD